MSKNNTFQNDTLIDKIIDESSIYADEDVSALECFEMYCHDHGLDMNLAKQAAKKWFTDEALAHGIPLSVIQGKTRLSDHFSQDYIKSQCSSNDIPEIDHDLFEEIDGIVFKK